MIGGHSHHHHHHPIDTTDPARYAESRKVTWISVILNSILSLAQIVVGIVGHSHALVADGVHTLSDLVTDGLVLFALKQGSKGADEEHPYGHGRIETAVTLVLGSALVFVAAGIAWQAGSRFFTPAPFVIPSVLALWVAVATLVLKEGLYRYTLRTAARYSSALLTANAWHHRSDAISSLIVVAGVGGAIWGFAYLDALAAIAVSLLVAKIGLQLAWRALKELIDTAVSPEEREVIKTVIESVGGVKALHLLRTRRVGDHVFVDVHILVDRYVSVSEGHQIGEVVRSRLLHEIGPVSDVTVHVDSEEDDDGIEHPDLPLRAEILKRLDQYFRDIPEAKLVRRTTLHYGGGRVDVELQLPLAIVDNAEQARAITRRFTEAVRFDKDIGRVEIGFY
jgi:cation diffusion facilitator family transporter